MTTLKKSFGVFGIGISFGLVQFIIEYAIEVLQKEAQEFDLIQFLQEYLELKGDLAIIIFIVLFPISLYLSFKPYKIKVDVSYIIIGVTGYAWPIMTLMIIESLL